MIMALLIGLLLRGGKFLTLAARRTLWQMFESSECGPRLLLTDDRLLRLARAHDLPLFAQDKDIQTSPEELLAFRSERALRHANGDNQAVQPRAGDLSELQRLEGEVDGALQDLERAAPPTDPNLERILQELERKVQEVDANEPVLLPAMLPQEVARKKSGGDSFTAAPTLEQCLSKYKIGEQELSEPVSYPDNHLKPSISDDLYVKFGSSKSRRYFQRISEQFASSISQTSLPSLACRPLGFCSWNCRSLHTRAEAGSAVKKMLHDAAPLERMEDDAIRSLLDRKIKMLVEKKNKRKRSKLDRTEIKEREKLLDINTRVFNKLERDIKSVKIIKKEAAPARGIDVDELLAMLDDSPKINFVKNMKLHKNVAGYEAASAADFIVNTRPQPEETSSSLPFDASEITSYLAQTKTEKRVLNIGKLNEEVQQRSSVKQQTLVQNESTIKVLVKFMSYEQIPRICHLSKEALENEFTTKLVALVTSLTKEKPKLKLSRDGEVMNKLKLQEEVAKKAQVKTAPVTEEDSKASPTKIEPPEMKKEMVAQSDRKEIQTQVTDVKLEETKVKAAEVKEEVEAKAQQQSSEDVLRTETSEPELEVLMAEKIRVTSDDSVEIARSAAEFCKAHEKTDVLKEECVSAKEQPSIDGTKDTEKNRTQSLPKMADLKAEDSVQIKPSSRIIEAKKSETPEAEAVTVSPEVKVQASATILKSEIIDKQELPAENVDAKSNELENVKSSTTEKMELQAPVEILKAETCEYTLGTHECGDSLEAVKIPETKRESVKELKRATSKVEQEIGEVLSKRSEDKETERKIKEDLQEKRDLHPNEKDISATKADANRAGESKIARQRAASPQKRIEIQMPSTKVENDSKLDNVSSNAMEVKATKTKTETPERPADFEKVKTATIQNALPCCVEQKSKIPIRIVGAHSKDSSSTPEVDAKTIGNMDTANRTIQKMAEHYKNQKAGKIIAMSPVLSDGIKMRSAHMTSKVPRPRRAVVKDDEDENDDQPERADDELHCRDVNEVEEEAQKKKAVAASIAASVEEPAEPSEERKKTSAKTAENTESVSTMLKIVDKTVSELKADGKTDADCGIQDEMPPDFDVLTEAELLDIPLTEEGRQEVPVEMKHKVEASEKSLAHVKLCSGDVEEKEMLGQLLSQQKQKSEVTEKLQAKEISAQLTSEQKEKSEPTEKLEAKKSSAAEEKQMVALPSKPKIKYPFSELNRGSRRNITSSGREEEEEEDEEEEKAKKAAAAKEADKENKAKEMEEWKFEGTKEYPLCEALPTKVSHSNNDVEALKKSSTEQQKEVRHALHSTVLNNSSTIKKAQSFATLPKYTFWNRQSKAEVNKKTKKEKVKEEQQQQQLPQKDEEQEQQEKKEDEAAPKRYKFVTEEIDAIGGGKMKVTKLVEDL